MINMNAQALINAIISDSARTDLDSSKVLYYLNRFKLQYQRTQRLRFSEATTPINLVSSGSRNIDLPADYLHPGFLRRSKGDIEVRDASGLLTIRKNRLTRWLDKYRFELHFPDNNDVGTPITGVVNDYIIYGNSFKIGPQSDRDETLYFDYWRLLPDYNLTSNITDEFSRLAYDVLIAGSLEQIFTWWTKDLELAAKAKEQRKEAEVSFLVTMPTIADSNDIDLRIEEYDGAM